MKIVLLTFLILALFIVILILGFIICAMILGGSYEDK